MVSLCLKVSTSQTHKHTFSLPEVVVSAKRPRFDWWRHLVDKKRTASALVS